MARSQPLLKTIPFVKMGNRLCKACQLNSVWEKKTKHMCKFYETSASGHPHHLKYSIKQNKRRPRSQLSNQTNKTKMKYRKTVRCVGTVF